MKSVTADTEARRETASTKRRLANGKVLVFKRSGAGEGSGDDSQREEQTAGTIDTPRVRTTVMEDESWAWPICPTLDSWCVLLRTQEIHLISFLKFEGFLCLTPSLVWDVSCAACWLLSLAHTVPRRLLVFPLWCATWRWASNIEMDVGFKE